ncbi:hypothetical protein DRW41_02155 [Neobacillus piezotolerans]|uniref:DUF4129 domain-containing protein n=1 Tax=Neobacillus piezotolerans TaxID=2259171 RepID=A0A3D8GW51_9BACI|nr:hypothetical protein [Neobacillus piezotolerans]RDU38391.1 hypothetical protein DRW41_02155 [Neobacillus piezotolerans]
MKRLYLFLIELLFTAMLIYPYFWPKEKGWQVFPGLSLFLIVFILYTWLLARLGEKAKILFLAIFLPALYAIGTFYSGLHPVPVATGIAFLFWRGNSLAGRKNEDHDLLLATFSAMAAFPAMIGAHTKNETIFLITIILVLMQVLVVLTGRFLLNLAKMEGEQKEKAAYLAFFGKLVIPIVLAGGLIALAMDYIQAAFFMVLKGVAWIFGMMATPILKWSETVNLWTDPDGANQIEVIERPGVAKVMREQAMQKYSELGLMVLAGLIIIGLFIYLYIKRNRVQFDYTKANSAGLSRIMNPAGGIAKKKKPAAPDNPLRREVFNLEYYALKNGFGRFEAETVGEWLSRIGILSNQKLIGIYEGVRYGNKDIGQPELEFARGELKGIRESIKEKRKELKKKQKKRE